MLRKVDGWERGENTMIVDGLQQNCRSEATPPHGHEPTCERHETCEQKGADQKNRNYSAAFDAIIPPCDANLARLELESGVCAKYVHKSLEMVPVRSHAEH